MATPDSESANEASLPEESPTIGLHFEIMTDHKQTVRAGYNAMAAEYLARRSVDSEDVQLLQELVQRLPRGARVLDTGCGAGVPVTQILSHYFEVTGVDFAAAQIELARELLPGARFVCQDITELGFAGGSFEAVCSYYAIIHIPRQEHRQLLRGFHRVLKRDGLALLCMGAADSPGDTEESYCGAPMYWSHYDAATNLQMLRECGFNVRWYRIVADPDGSGGAHLFVLAQKDSTTTRSYGSDDFSRRNATGSPQLAESPEYTPTICDRRSTC